MEILFFTINDQIKMDKNHKFLALIVDENRKVIKSLVKTLKIDNESISKVLSHKYDKIITLDNSMKEKLINNFSYEKELLKVIEKID